MSDAATSFWKSTKRFGPRDAVSGLATSQSGNSGCAFSAFACQRGVAGAANPAVRAA
jgi:hypothetical protein